jgi:predicted ATPase/DNA-binding SARP family transcriptional activator
MHRALEHPEQDGPETDPAVVLAAIVDWSAQSLLSGRPVVGHDAQARLVRALLGGSAGRALEGSSGDACLAFDSWRSAVDGALSVAAHLSHLGSEFAGIEVRYGLEPADGTNESVAAGRAGSIASGAEPGEIRFGESLAALITLDPPQRLVARPVEASQAGARGVHRLLRARDEVPNNLVESGTTFVGRTAEIDAIGRLLDRGHLVTITGPPGIGKSRLAAELADRILGRFADGGWFVPLAPVAESALVMSAIADAVGIPVPPGVLPVDAVIAHVRDRRLLLVLDNCEHVTGSGSDIADLLGAAEGMRVIATSQVRLGIPGEEIVALAPFDVPVAGASAEAAGGSAAVRLFGDRAGGSPSPFRLDPDNMALAAEICRRLDGLPLAIELVAARVRLLPLTAIRDRLDTRLGITADAPDRAARQHSLRAAIGWSYDLLDDPAKALFRRLSVFRGGWTVDSVLAVCAADTIAEDAVLASLATLENASLVARDEGPATTPRFTMLETLRQFAAEQLELAGEVAETRRRHADYFLGLAARLGPRLTGPEQATALDHLAVEHDNTRAAIAHLLGVDPPGALRLCAAIWRFWQMRGYLGEGSRSIATALAGATEASRQELADGHAAAGGIAYWRRDLIEAERHYQEAARLRRAVGDAVSLGDALFDLAFVFDPALRPPPEDPERTAEGIRIAEEAHAIYIQADHAPGVAKSEWLLGSIVAHRDIERAMALLGSSVEQFRRLGDPFGLGWALHSYGLVLLRSTDSASAAAAFTEAIGLFSAAGDGSAIALLLDDIAEVAKAEGDALRAARLRGAAAGMRRSTEAELVVANAPWLASDGVPHGLIDPAALERAWADGQAMSQAEATAYALRSESATHADSGLRISALGPLLVERFGEAVSDWGGPKAGSRHALAIFAFLMDRGQRGVTKDEIVEVVWPDAEVEQGDLNFHRTLGGLRSRLAQRPDGRPGHDVIFTNGRYRLAPSVVSWLDVAEFEQRLLNAAEATDELAAIRGLESARQLYRGDYLDDCPLYGDSEYVEERRGFLRGRLVDALVDLGRRYEARQDDSLASARFREALSVAGGNCPSASEGLQRLGVVAT